MLFTRVGRIVLVWLDHDIITQPDSRDENSFHINCKLLLADFNQNWNSMIFKSPISIFMKIRSAILELFLQTDRRTVWICAPLWIQPKKTNEACKTKRQALFVISPLFQHADKESIGSGMSDYDNSRYMWRCVFSSGGGVQFESRTSITTAETCNVCWNDL